MTSTVLTRWEPENATFWRDRGVKYFYIHSDPFLRIGLAGIKTLLGR